MKMTIDDPIVTSEAALISGLKAPTLLTRAKELGLKVHRVGNSKRKAVCYFVERAEIVAHAEQMRQITKANLSQRGASSQFTPSQPVISARMSGNSSPCEDTPTEGNKKRALQCPYSQNRPRGGIPGSWGDTYCCNNCVYEDGSDCHLYPQTVRLEDTMRCWCGQGIFKEEPTT